MNSAVKFLFLPTIDVIFLLTLPDTYPLLVAHLPALLLWAINVCCWRRAKHSNHTAAHWQQPLLSGLPSHRAVSWQGKVGEMGKQACWKAEFAWQYWDQATWKTIRGKRETGESSEWPREPAPHTEPRALQAFPCCYCFCPEWDLCRAMLFCANDSAWRHWPLHYVATWCSGNKLTVFMVILILILQVNCIAETEKQHACSRDSGTRDFLILEFWLPLIYFYLHVSYMSCIFICFSSVWSLTSKYPQTSKEHLILCEYRNWEVRWNNSHYGSKCKAAHAIQSTWAAPLFSRLIWHTLHFKREGRQHKVTGTANRTRHAWKAAETQWKQLLLPSQRSNTALYLWALPSTASTFAVWPAPASSLSAGLPVVWRTATLPCAPLLAPSHTTNPAAPTSWGTRCWSPLFPRKSQCSPGLSCSSPAPAWSFHKCSASGHRCWPHW